MCVGGGWLGAVLVQCVHVIVRVCVLWVLCEGGRDRWSERALPSLVLLSCGAGGNDVLRVRTSYLCDCETGSSLGP